MVKPWPNTLRSLRPSQRSLREKTVLWFRHALPDKAIVASHAMALSRASGRPPAVHRITFFIGRHVVTEGAKTPGFSVIKRFSEPFLK
jgi:hypothetical protein